MLERVRWIGRIASCAVAAVVLATLAVTIPPAAPAEAADPALFGAYAKRDGDPAGGLEALEQTLGTEFGAERRFLWWNDRIDTDPVVTASVAEGAVPLISVRPVWPGGGKIPWADIANAPEGSALDNRMEQIGAELAAVPGRVWFAFHHEAEAQVNLPHGTAAEFQAAYRRVVDEIRGQGADRVEFVWITTTYAFRVPAADRRHGPDWFPGAAHVDHFAADAYNWGDCRPGIDQIEPWAAITGPWLDFTAGYPAKGVIIAEFGTVEEAGDPQAKAEWLEDLRRDLALPKWDRLEALIAFHSEHGAEYPACQWYLDTSAASLAAARLLADDARFGGDAPPPPAAPVVCSVADGPGGSAVVTVDNQPGNDIVLRDGRYAASLGNAQTTWTDPSPAPGGSTYTLRVWYGNNFLDYPCGTGGVGGPAPSCSVALSADERDVIVSWSDTEGTVVVRRDGSWLATPGAVADGSVTDTDVTPALHTYSLRLWAGGTSTDVDCGSITVPPPAADECTVTRFANGVQVDWTPRSGTVILRRDGFWLATPPAGSSSYWDANPAPGSHSYELRVWVAGGSFVDEPCGSVVVP